MWTTGNRAVAAVVVALSLSGAAFAHGGSTGGSGSGGSGGGSSGGAASGSAGQRDAKPSCPAGYAAKDGNCVRVSSGVLPDAELYRQGRALALAGFYTRALPILEAVARTDDPMVFTMRGFATRKLGRYAQAMRLYDRALAIDPDNINTHEYIGESYVELKRPDLARAELAKVAKSCGPGCEQYDDLAEAIETGKTE